MAKLSFILTLFLITVSFSTFSSAIPDDDVTFPTKKTLLLPSDNPEPDQLTTISENPKPKGATAVGFSEITEETSENHEPEGTTTVGFPDITAEVSEMPVDRPMKIIRLHPINRHFPGGQLGSFRVPRHRCRHGGMGQPMRPRHVSFGDESDDMMVPSGENGDFDTMVPVLREEAPERWIRFHRHHPHHLHHRHDEMPMGKHHDFFADKRFSMERGERFPMRKHHEFFAREREERQDQGFMRSVRKFLNGRF